MDGSERGDAVRTLAKGAAVLYIGTFASKALMYLYRVLVARYLGPADYGLLNLGLATFWIAMTFTMLGVGSGIQRRITDYMGRGEKERIPEVVWTALVLTVPWSLVVAAALFLFAEPIAVLGFHDPAAAPVIRILAIALPFQLLYADFANVAKAYRRMEFITYVDKIARSAITLGVTVALLWAGYGLMGAVVAQLAAVFVSALMIVYLVESRIEPFLRRSAPTLSESRWLARYSAPLFLSGVVGLLVGWTDTVLLGFFDTSANVGVYQAAYPTAKLLTIVGGNMATVLFPTISEMYGAGKKAEAMDLARTAVKWIFALNFPALVMMVLFAEQGLRLLFGNDYTAGAAALAFLGTAYFLRSMTNHAGSFIKSEEWTRLSFINSVAVAGVNVVLNVLLIPMYSTAGAGMATAIALTLGAVLATAEAYYFFDINPYRFRDYLAPFLATVLAAAATYLSLHALFDPVPPLALIPAAGLFGILYGALYVALGGLSEDDLEVLRAIDRRTDVNLEPAKRVIRRLREVGPR